MNQARVLKLRGQFKKEKVQGLFVSNPSNIFYLTGLSQFIHAGDAFVLVTKNGFYLFTNALYADGVASAEGVNVCILNAEKPLRVWLSEIISRERCSRIGVESGDISLAFFEMLGKVSGITLVATNGLVERVRVLKDARETALVKQACRLTDEAFEEAVRLLQKGRSEKEIAFRIEVFIRENGGELAFPVIVAYGKNAAIPHHQNSDKKLSKPDTLVLMDFGAKVDGYCSDITRTVFVDTPSETVASTYDSLLDVQKRTIKFAEEQKIGSNLSKIALFAEGLMDKESLPPFPHLLGHGLGIDIHEEPRVGTQSDDKLIDGMIFTIEPGIYVPGHLGIRIEDTVGVVDGALKTFIHSPKGRVVISI